jgi:hypothetical protein
MKRIIVLAGGALLSTSLAVQGQVVELSPFYGYRFGGEIQIQPTGEHLSLKDAPAYGIAVDFAPKGGDFKLELLWSHQESSVNFNGYSGLGKVDVDVDQFMIGGVAETERGPWRAYVTGMLGATYFSSESNGSDTRFGLSVGVGAKYFLIKNRLALRADARGYCSFVSSEGAFIYYNGVTVATFSGSTLWQGEVSAGITLGF